MIGSSIMPEAILPPAASASSAKITAMHSSTSYHNRSPRKAAPEHQLLRCTPGVLPARSRRLVGREHCDALRRRAPCACQRHHRRQHARHRQANLCRFACGAPARDVGLETQLVAVHGSGTSGLAQPTAHLAPLHTSACVVQISTSSDGFYGECFEAPSIRVSATLRGGGAGRV